MATSKKNSKQLRKIPCRYGIGCTHIQDAYHREKFFHPCVPLLDQQQLRTHYICNECGEAFLNLSDLQLHLKRKTAWSNESLVGCRVSCLLDHREWHEGIVLGKFILLIYIFYICIFICKYIYSYQLNIN